MFPAERRYVLKQVVINRHTLRFEVVDRTA